MVQSLHLTLTARKRWFFRPALMACLIGLRFGLIRAKASFAHIGGIETADERAARWLAERAIKIEAA